jgi:nitrite reductase/ring-hydroxylating ferredoxin subunit
MPTVQLPLEDLPLNTPFALDVEGLKIVVIRTPGGVRAFEDMCPHAFWPLSAGTVRDGLIECPGHGWEFRLDSGICVDSPAYCLTPIAANIVGGMVHLDRTESSAVRLPQPPTQKPCAGTHARATQDLSSLRK